MFNSELIITLEFFIFREDKYILLSVSLVTSKVFLDSRPKALIMFKKSEVFGLENLKSSNIKTSLFFNL